MRKREPPESHKQRFYKLPQLSWSWVATLIVYWGDFSSEGYYLHIRNSYTFKSSWRISAIFSALCFRQKSFYPSQRLAVVRQVCRWCVRSPSVFNLKSLLQIIFHWLKKGYVAVSNWTRAVPLFFCPIGEIFSFPMCWCVCGSRCLSVKIFYINP